METVQVEAAIMSKYLGVLLMYQSAIYTPGNSINVIIEKGYKKIGVCVWLHIALV